MEIKKGTMKKDTTCYGNKYWIQIDDTVADDNSDLESLVDVKITVIIGKAEPRAKEASDDSL